MLDKIKIFKQRFDEVSDLIIQPDIIMDQKRYVKLNKEYKDLGQIVEKSIEYETYLNNIAEAKEIISDGSDAARRGYQVYANSERSRRCQKCNC